MPMIGYGDLSQIRRKHIEQKIVYCSGSFDLVHAGHILFFEDCKKLGDILIVNVGPDYDIRLLKGEGRPILNQSIRLYAISQLKPVDYCFLGKNMTDPQKPLGGMMEIFMKLRPDIYVVNEDAFDIPSRKNVSQKCGVELNILKRHCPPEFYGISTSKIIGKIQQLSDQGRRP